MAQEITDVLEIFIRPENEKEKTILKILLEGIEKMIGEGIRAIEGRGAKVYTEKERYWNSWQYKLTRFFPRFVENAEDQINQETEPKMCFRHRTPVILGDKCYSCWVEENERARNLQEQLLSNLKIIERIEIGKQKEFYLKKFRKQCPNFVKDTIRQAIIVFFQEKGISLGERQPSMIGKEIDEYGGIIQAKTLRMVSRLKNSDEGIFNGFYYDPPDMRLASLGSTGIVARCLIGGFREDFSVLWE